MRKFIVLAALLAINLAGCSDDDHDPVQPPVDLRPPSADGVVAAWMLSLESLDAGAYGVLLNDDFRLVLQQQTVDEYGLPRGWLDADEDLAATVAAFGGGPAPRPGQIPQAGLMGVTVELLQARGLWGSAPASDHFPGCPGAGYDLVARCVDANGLRTTISGVLMMYVHADSTDATDVRYELAGIIDLTGEVAGKRVAESLTWGALKAMFLPLAGI